MTGYIGILSDYVQIIEETGYYALAYF